MAGPWEKYAQQSSQPWAKYGGKLSPADLQAKLRAQAQAYYSPENLATKYQEAQTAQTAEMPWYQRMAAGAGKAVVDTGRGIGELFGAVTPQDIQQSRIQDQALMATPAAKVGNVLGYVGEAVPATMAAGAVGVSAPAALAAKMGIGGITGAAQGYAMPYTTERERIQNALVSGALGAGIPGIGGAIGAGARGLATPEARALMNEGVKLTPGQMLGGGFKTLEDKLTSVPIVGTAIKRGQQRSIETFNTAALNRALKPLGIKLPAGMAGYPAIEKAGKAVSDMYDATLNQMKGSLDQGLASDIGSVWNRWASKLPKSQANELDKYITENIASKFDPNGQISGQAAHMIQSDLGEAASKLKRSDELGKRQLGQALTDLRAGVKDMLKRNNPQNLNDAYAAATAAHKQMVRINKAAGMVGSSEGVFTPAQLRSAVRATDSTRNKMAFARGRAEMQDLAERAQGALPSKVPDSGTAGRYMMDAALLGGGAASGHLLPLAAAGGVAHALYSAPGQRVAESLLAPQMNPVRNYLARLAQSRLTSPANALMSPALLPQAPVVQQQ